MVYNNKGKVIKMIKFEKEKFSIRLSELMKNNGDTVYTLADAVHLTPGTISKYVNGKIDLIYRYAKKKKAAKSAPRKAKQMSQDEPLEIIETRVAGVSFNNDDGTSRQEILKRCTTGESIRLIHAPMPGHEFAVKVLRENGEQLGYIPSEDAEDVESWVNSANKVTAKIKKITGGTQDKPTVGCVIEIRID